MKLRSSIFSIGSAYLLSVVTISIGTIPIVASQDSYDPITQFCRRFYHQAARIGNRLYIDGGYVTYQDNHAGNKTNTRLLFQNLDQNSAENMPQLVNNLTKPLDVPSVVGGALWADQVNEKLYLFGGEYPDGVPSGNSDPSALWTYDPWKDGWSKVPMNSKYSRPSFGASVSVEEIGTGFYLGGWLDAQNTPGWTGDKFALNTLMSYDMTNNVLQNLTGPAGDPRVEGVLLYVPAGDKGMLVSFGGMYVGGGYEKNNYPAPMSDIDVYDISQSKWYRVNATGDIPSTRRRFCGGVANAEDHTSVNAYIYGGASAGNGTGSNDVYILSMPTFKWIQFYPPDNPKSLPAIHNGFTCSVIDNTQMLIIGGTYPFDDSVCDAIGVTGVHSLDLGKSNLLHQPWYQFQQNLTKYNVPDDVYDVIGGSANGSAVKMTPDGGFNSTDLTTLFSRVYVPLPRKPTRTPSSGGNTKETNIPVVVGSSVGVGVPVLAALFGIFLFRRRARAQKKAKEGNNFVDRERQLPPLPPVPYGVHQLATVNSPTFPPKAQGYGLPSAWDSKNSIQQPYGSVYRPPYTNEVKVEFIPPQELPAGNEPNSDPRGAMTSASVRGPPITPAGIITDEDDIIRAPLARTTTSDSTSNLVDRVLAESGEIKIGAYRGDGKSGATQGGTQYPGRMI